MARVGLKIIIKKAVNNLLEKIKKLTKNIKISKDIFLIFTFVCLRIWLKKCNNYRIILAFLANLVNLR